MVGAVHGEALAVAAVVEGEEKDGSARKGPPAETCPTASGAIAH